ncbi:phosphoglycerate mutase-like protein [Cristinia sonorae]|uniref:Phosphoglycerate mutase-like protein n=1 Tax=Cristinia sonorae TaxID=1940300 RepID=A0A8K0UGX0_9AGAR|nr:phosphoglycerate mutase-like protein [Cristinia sonorae]
MSTSNSDVIGIVVVARHGDRQGFYQDPDAYTASATSITPLGEQQEFELGSLIRSQYLTSSSPSFIRNISTGLFDQTQVAVRADAGGEGGVIFDSAVALLQGLFPATRLSNTTLANGQVVTSPLGGYQYVPIESVEPNQDVSLEGYTSCNTFAKRNNAFYDSPEFLAKAKESESFLEQLQPHLDGRNATLENMWNIFDYMNVQSIHNKTFADNLPPTFLAQARALANYHEYGVFTDNTLGGIGNIAGTAIMPSLLTAFQRIANQSDPLKLHYSATAYKPLLSLFNMTGVVANGELPAAIVNYAAGIVFEVRRTAGSSEPVIRFTFKNGTDDATFKPHPMSFPGFTGTPDNTDAPLSAFVNAFAPVGINTTLQWCNVCNQTSARGCAALLAGSAGQPFQVTSPHGHAVSPVGAGFIGAGVTIVVMSALVALALAVGLLSLGKKGRKVSRPEQGSESSIQNLKF